MGKMNSVVQCKKLKTSTATGSWPGGHFPLSAALQRGDGVGQYGGAWARGADTAGMNRPAAA